MKSAGKFPYLIGIVTLLGFLVYTAWSFNFAHTSLSIADEGTYLFKGYYFARGEYRLFQEYGFWTNKSPLSFLIPGYIQLWFGPGLRVGRYFAILVSVLTLTGLWISANRLAGGRWAAVAVWVLALSDAHISTYSLALSQGLVACLISWMCVCVAGGDRPLWQLTAGAALAVLVVMTRQNMVVILPLLVLYVFWQYGRRAGLWVFATSVLLFTGFHLWYWPGILQLWAPWLPPALTPFLDEFRFHAVSGVASWDVENLSRLQSVVKGLRDHFFLFGGFAGALILFPSRSDWRSTGNFKTAIFLGVTFAALFLMHTWGSIFNRFCVQCFTSYQMFYSVTGILFVVVVLSNRLAESFPRRLLLIAVLLVLSMGIGLHYYQQWGDAALETLQLPRLSRLFSDGENVWVPLGEALSSRFNLPIGSQRRIASAITGGLGAVLLCFFVWTIHRIARRNGGTPTLSPMRAALNVFLVLGVILPPAIEAGSYSTRCSADLLADYEKAGRALSDVIPPDSLIYWKGSGRHIALMLYVDDVRIFAPQINAGGGYYLSGEREELLRFGVFDVAIDAEWRALADVFILWQGYPGIKLGDFENDPGYERIPYNMGSLTRCEEPLYLFRRTP